MRKVLLCFAAGIALLFAPPGMGAREETSLFLPYTPTLEVSVEFGHSEWIMFRGVWWVNLSRGPCTIASFVGSTRYLIACLTREPTRGDIRDLPFGAQYFIFGRW